MFSGMHHALRATSALQSPSSPGRKPISEVVRWLVGDFLSLAFGLLASLEGNQEMNFPLLAGLS